MGIGQSIRKFADRARDKVKPEQAESGIEKAGDKVDQVTGGKYADKVDQAQEKAKDAARKNVRDDTSGPATRSESRPGSRPESRPGSRPESPPDRR